MLMLFCIDLVPIFAIFATVLKPVYNRSCFVQQLLNIFFQRFYIATARQVKRLESISRSPIYSHFGETISGAVTIRAYGMAPNFIKENEMKIDINQVSCFNH